jgi:hypothetical protein
MARAALGALLVLVTVGGGSALGAVRYGAFKTHSGNIVCG